MAGAFNITLADMSISPIWDVKTTRELILHMYGKEQFLKANQSLISALQRKDFARFHYFEAAHRWKAQLDDVRDLDPIEVVLDCGDDNAVETRAQRMDELAAHVHACVHSLHTIPDTMAHALYYGLALNIGSCLKERQISAATVAKKLGNVGSHTKLLGFFQSIYLNGDFPFIEALNNHGKHRSLVRTGTWFDMTGSASDPVTLELSDFDFDGVRHVRREILPLLASEYERVSKAVVDCGIEMLHVLQGRCGEQGNSST
jgi:hypothetical protein